MIWSVGAIMEEASRVKFQNYVQDLIKGAKLNEIYHIDTINEFVPFELKNMF